MIDSRHISCHFIRYKPVNDRTIFVAIWYVKTNDLKNKHLPIHLPYTLLGIWLLIHIGLKLKNVSKVTTDRNESILSPWIPGTTIFLFHLFHLFISARRYAGNNNRSYHCDITVASPLTMQRLYRPIQTPLQTSGVNVWIPIALQFDKYK